MMQKFVPSKFQLKEFYSNDFTEWLRDFMNTGALPIGPAHLIVKPGDYLVSPLTNGAIAALMGEDGVIRAFHNSCPHRQKILFPIPGIDKWTPASCTGTKSGVIVCGGHSWGFDLTGERNVHSPGCSGLLVAGEVADIGNSLWVGTKDELARVSEILPLPLMVKYGVRSLIPAHHRIHAIRVFRERYRPFTGLDVFGDVDHVDDETHEETLKRVASVAGLEIDLSAPSQSVSAQIVPWLSSCDPRKTSLTWRRFHEEAAKRALEEEDSATFSRIVWLQESRSGNTYEHFPGMTVESRFAPDPEGPGTMNIVCFYFPEDVLAFRTEENDTDEYGDIVHWGMKAYMDLAKEDARLAEEEDQGSMNLVRHGLGDRHDGYYGDHEEGVSHQYDRWLKSQWLQHKRSRIFMNQVHVPGIHPTGAQLDVWAKR